MLPTPGRVGAVSPPTPGDGVPAPPEATGLFAPDQERHVVPRCKLWPMRDFPLYPPGRGYGASWAVPGPFPSAGWPNSRAASQARSAGLSACNAAASASTVGVGPVSAFAVQAVVQAEEPHGASTLCCKD